MNPTKWFKIRRYPHIGFPISDKEKRWVLEYVQNKEAISRHAFSPFIRRIVKKRRFRRRILPNGKRSSVRIPTFKKREVFYSNHLDSNIFSYYGWVLQNSYEQKLEKNGLHHSVTAYRKIREPESGPTRNKCNIDFARNVFDFIKHHHERKLVAVTFDIKSFFDSLDHASLKKSWITLLESGSALPADHYQVFKNITKFSYINEWELFEALKTKIWVEREDSPQLRQKPIDKRKYLREKRAIAYCTKDKISWLRENKFIKSNKHTLTDNGDKALRLKGIPQGSPISAVLANIYMLSFDKKINDFISRIDGIYRRYSDDMVVVAPLEHEARIMDIFDQEISAINLQIQDSKTQVFHFEKSGERYFCCEKNLETDQLIPNRQFEYLGFAFDGKYVMLRSQSLARFYRRMKRQINYRKYHATHSKTSTKGEIFKNRLYKRFTFKGANRRRIYQRSRQNNNKWVRSTQYDWGNFLSYTKMAERIFPENKIKSQTRNHWRIFHEELGKYK